MRHALDLGRRSIARLLADSAPILERRKGVIDTPDDEFESTTLDSKWTIVDGAVGTVDLAASSTTGIFDLTTRPGWLLAQCQQSNIVQLRQDYTLPDGKSIVLAMISTIAVDSGFNDSEIWCGLILNSDDTTPYSAANEASYIIAKSLPGYLSITSYARNGGTPTILGVLQHTQVGFKVYLRIMRIGTTYYFLVSFNGGLSWFPCESDSVTSAHNNLWIEFGSYASAFSIIPIHGADWIRLGSNNLDPW